MPRGGVEVKLYSSFNLGAKMGVGGQRHAPAALPRGNTQYQLHRRPVGPQGRSGRVRKISPPPGFDPLTVRPLASRYTEYFIPARIIICIYNSCSLMGEACSTRVS